MSANDGSHIHIHGVSCREGIEHWALQWINGLIRLGYLAQAAKHAKLTRKSGRFRTITSDILDVNETQPGPVCSRFTRKTLRAHVSAVALNHSTHVALLSTSTSWTERYCRPIGLQRNAYRTSESDGITSRAAPQWHFSFTALWWCSFAAI